MPDLSSDYLFAATEKGPFKLVGPFRRIKLNGNDFITAGGSFPELFGMWSPDLSPLVLESHLFADFGSALDQSRRLIDEIISSREEAFARTLASFSY